LRHTSVDGGFLMLGRHEHLPAGIGNSSWEKNERVYFFRD
jgi:hypothetical protein